MKKMIEKDEKTKGKREQKLKSFSALCCCCVVLTRRGGSDDARRRRRSCLVKGERNHRYFLVLLLYFTRIKSEKERLITFLSVFHPPRLFSSPTEPTTKTRRKRNKRKKERDSKQDDERGHGRDRHVSVSVSREGGIRRRKRTERDG